MTTMKCANVVAVGVAAALALGAIASKGESSSVVVMKEGVPGGVRVDTVTVTAKVTAVDATNRLVSIERQDGVKRTIKCGPEVVNFGQIKVGDQVSLTVAESLVVFLTKGSEQATVAVSGAAVAAPEGEKPGLVVEGTVEVKTTVKALDVEGHKATLEFPNGASQAVDVRKDVDLTQVQVGDTVTIRMTEAVAIRVDEKP